MSRYPRKRSVSGIYHVMLKGIDGRDIFLENYDKIKFMRGIKKAKDIGEFKLFGYCLMDNHVHLLIEEGEAIGTSIKRMTIGYVLWHNNKYGRTGHLFQNRYASEPVETEGYFMSVLRYIHLNPLKAGIVKHPANYNWSSYSDYISSYNGVKTVTDVQLIKLYLKQQEDFEGYMNIRNYDISLKYNCPLKYSDNSLKKLIDHEYYTNFAGISRESRNKIIKEIYQETGASIRQLGRVLGLGKTIIEKAVK